MRYLILGTAGHVDHGKTSLIRALTGIETDRLPEEKARGMSIELGFAYADLPDGTRAGIVDVPGHERFIDTMVSGAYGMDVVLFVVSAKEGAKPQTVEHLQILDLLGVRHGILVLTMCDLVTDEELEFAIEETKELLEGTTLAGIPHVAVSSLTGEGIGDLRALLLDVAHQAQTETEETGLPRLPIDRVFTLEGFGLIITGTLNGGSLEVEQRVLLSPHGAIARIRSIQVHGKSVSQASDGQRTALNLVGVEKEQLERGAIVTVPELVRTTQNVDVSLRVVETFPRIVEHWTRARLHIGTREVFCRIVLLKDKDGLLPGAASVAQLRLEEPILAVRGDRFIVRDASAEHTLGGGVVLDPLAPRHRRFTEPTRAALERIADDDSEALLTYLLERAKNPFVETATLAYYFPRHKRDREHWLETLQNRGILVRAGEAVIAAERLRVLQEAVQTDLEAFHRSEPLAPGKGTGELRTALKTPLTDRDFDWLMETMGHAGHVVQERNLIRLRSHEIAFGAQDAPTRDRIETLFRDAGLSSPSMSELENALKPVPAERVAKIVQTLTHIGVLIRVADDYWTHQDAYAATLETLKAHLRQHGELDIGTFRELTSASRKYAVPFLEHCDAKGYTYRQGNVRRGRPAFLA